MAVASGTVTGHVALLNALVNFLTTTMSPANERWTLLKTQVVDGEEERYLRGPGLSNTDEIFVNLRTHTSTPWGAYNWEISGATGFDTNQGWEDQAGINPSSLEQGLRVAPTLPLTNENINYTFIANGRRFIVIASFGDFVTTMYAGFILPYATTTEYPYPLLIAGSSCFTMANRQLFGPSTLVDEGTSGVSRSDYIRTFFNPISLNEVGQQCFLYSPQNDWRQISGDQISSSRGPSANVEIVASWPWTLVDTGFSSRVTIAPLTNKDNTYMLLPGVLCWTLRSLTSTSINSTQLAEMMTYGEYDGVYFVSSFNLTSLDTFTVNGSEYTVVRDSLDSRNTKAGAIRRA